jgi:plasmid stabilization system protein ParE
MGNWVNKSSQSKDDNLETFSLIWLDAKVNKTRDNRRAQQKLRHIINHIKIFKDQQQCEQYILLLSPQDRVVLIVSGQCGRQLVPQIHQLRQISSIYVYCMDKEGNEQWAKDYTKVEHHSFLF